MLLTSLGSAHDLGSFVPRLATFSGLYQYTRFNTIKVTYTTVLSTSNVGAVSLGFNPDCNATYGAAIEDVANLQYSTISDCKSSFSISIPCRTLHESSARYGPWLTNTHAASNEQCAMGVLQVMATNTAGGSGSLFGFLTFEVDVSFRQFTST
jgi:hypothetical protein